MNEEEKAMNEIERRIDGIQLFEGSFSRRRFLQAGALAGSSLVLAACGFGTNPTSLGTGSGTPRRGGTLRVALGAGQPDVDNLDPWSSGGAAHFQHSYRQLVYSKLTDLSADGTYSPQLAESLEPSQDAKSWQIKLKDASFHDGSSLTADDVIYTYRYLLDPANHYDQAASAISMIDPHGLKKIDDKTLVIGLNKPWSALPSAVGQRFVSIVKAGAKAPFSAQNSNGTGAFKLTGWTPGTRYTYTANRNYFDHGKPYLDGLEVIGILDPAARLNALLAGQVEVISDVSVAELPALTSAKFKALVSKGGSWTPVYMNTTVAPFNDPNVRQAMKLLMNRPRDISSTVSGYGLLANDLFAIFDPLYASDIPQRQYDPEKAKALLKKAGQESTQFILDASNVQSDMVPQALVLEQGAKAAGIKLQVRQASPDTFWTNTYGKSPFTFSTWGYRSFFAQWLESYGGSNAVETRWGDDAFNQASSLVDRAAATSDLSKQKELTHQAQQLEWDDGGYIIAFFAKTVDGLSSRVQGLQPHIFPYLGWYHLWDVWMA